MLIATQSDWTRLVAVEPGDRDESDSVEQRGQREQGRVGERGEAPDREVSDEVEAEHPREERVEVGWQLGSVGERDEHVSADRRDDHEQPERQLGTAAGAGRGREGHGQRAAVTGGAAGRSSSRGRGRGRDPRLRGGCRRRGRSRVHMSLEVGDELARVRQRSAPTARRDAIVVDLRELAGGQPGALLDRRIPTEHSARARPCRSRRGWPRSRRSTTGARSSRHRRPRWRARGSAARTTGARRESGCPTTPRERAEGPVPAVRARAASAAGAAARAARRFGGSASGNRNDSTGSTSSTSTTTTLVLSSPPARLAASTSSSAARCGSGSLRSEPLDVALAHHGGEPVGADHDAVAGDDLDRVEIDLDLGVDAERA